MLSKGRGGWGCALLLLLFLTTMLSVCGFHLPCFGYGRGRKRTSEIRKNHNKLLYINMDGFRWDYVDDQPGSLPGFSRFLKDGVRAAWTNPPYPTLSFPGITTLVTGLYPEDHGIVGNFFFDKKTKEVFSMYDPFVTAMRKWYQAEPIWTTATRAGRRTALYFWARCDVAIDGVLPEVCMPFLPLTDATFFRHNLDKALDRFEDGFDFVQVYVGHADAVGHRFGAESKQRKKAVRELDSAILHLLQQLDCRGLTDEVNIVIVSDHGMTDVGPSHAAQLEIDNFLDTNLVENLADYGAFMNLKVLPGNVEKVRNQLAAMPGVDVYRHDQIPVGFNFTRSKFIHEIILQARPGVWVQPSKSMKQVPLRNDLQVYRGGHGYPPSQPDMKGIFFAKGPDFRKGTLLRAIDMVDIYQVLAWLLRVPARPHNGTWAHVEPALIR